MFLPIADVSFICKKQQGQAQTGLTQGRSMEDCAKALDIHKKLLK